MMPFLASKQARRAREAGLELDVIRKMKSVGWLRATSAVKRAAQAQAADGHAEERQIHGDADDEPVEARA